MDIVTHRSHDSPVMDLYLLARLYSRVLFVCIPRLLAVVVSLTFFAALLLYMTDRKVNTAVLVYDK